MKKMKWIALLSTLLGASVVLAACGGDGETGVKVGGEPKAAPEVEAIFSNFIKVEPEENCKDISSDAVLLNDDYGTLVQSQGTLYLFKKSDRTPLDEISTVYTVYDAKTKTVVFTKEFKYQNGDYSGTDIYGNQKRKPIEGSVTLSLNGCRYICVESTTYDKYSKEEMQEQIDELKDLAIIDDYIYGNGLLESYKVSHSYEYYSVDGKPIYTSVVACDYPRQISVTRDTATYLFGNVAAKLDENGALLEKWNVETESHVEYIEETEYYGYTSALYGGGYAFEVYNKTNNSLVYRYVRDISDMMAPVKLDYLSDGDLFVQKDKRTDGTSYDYIYYGEKYDVTTQRIDVETGTMKEVEFPYLIDRMYTKYDWSQLFDDEFVMTENVYNVAVANKIVDGNLLDDCVLVFFDDMFNVQYELGSLLPGHKIFDEYGDLNLDVLSSGDLLVNLDTPLVKDGYTVDRAIVTVKGELLSYVPQDAVIMDEYIIFEDDVIQIYNFDGSKEAEFNRPETDYDSYTWTALGRFGDGYLWQGTRWDEYSSEREYITYRIYETSYGYGSYYEGYLTDSVSYGYGRYMSGNVNYALFQDEDGEYNVYDGDMRCVFTTATYPSVVSYEDYLEIKVQLGGEDLVYILPYKTVTTGGAEK